MESISSHSYNLQYKKPPFKTFFEEIYRIGFIIKTKKEIDKINYAWIGSFALSKLIEKTSKQEEIYESLRHQPYMSINNIAEHVEIVKNIGQIYINYFPIYANDKLAFGATLQPGLGINFEQEIKIDANLEFLKPLHDLMNLISFFYGQQIVWDKLEIGTNNQNATCYFPKNKIKDSEYWPIIKFGWNTIYQSREPIHVDIFSKYLSLCEEVKDIFRKFPKFRDMINTEDRFLGFFRSLELLTKNKENYFEENKIEQFLIGHASTFTAQVSLKASETTSFFKRIKKLNSQKHSVEKGIRELIKEIPTETTKQIDIRNIDIKDMVQTRNDISHANFVTHDDRKLAIYATYIEYLLIYLLCKKLGFSSLHSAHYALNGGDARLHLGK